MAIDQGSETVVLTKKDRLWRAEFFVADDDSVQLRFHRELQAKAADGRITKDRESILTVVRSQSQIAAKTYQVGAATLTGQQILQAVNKMADDERQYDIDNPPTGGPA